MYDKHKIMMIMMGRIELVYVKQAYLKSTATDYADMVSLALRPTPPKNLFILVLDWMRKALNLCYVFIAVTIMSFETLKKGSRYIPYQLIGERPM